MNNKKNFLLGFGERLTEEISITGGGGKKEEPYTFIEAQQRLYPNIIKVSNYIKNLPQLTCPNNETVTLVTMHPTYLAKSYYPENFLKNTGLRSVGSRAKYVKLEKPFGKKKKDECTTLELYIAGQRRNFELLPNLINHWSLNQDSTEARDFIKFEDFRVQLPLERVKNIDYEKKDYLLEIVLHASQLPESDYILEGFEEYINSLGLKINFDRRIYSGGLCFIPMESPTETINKIAEFSFLRVLRAMPSLRNFSPILRGRNYNGFTVDLPKEEAIDKNIKAAIFDGGLPANSSLSTWARSFEYRDLKEAVPDGIIHGLGVTSSLLFGPLEKDTKILRPYSNVDHYRVIDKDSNGDLFDVLERIITILSTNKYNFINLSIGPNLPIDDDEVHVWTAKIDEILSKGDILAASAVGNDGECDSITGLSRIQPPSDFVNGLSVGACDIQGDNWKRASYSCMGPGRSPGIIKPDVLYFGGSETMPFWLLGSESLPFARPDCGTSFATPAVLRQAIGIRAHMGDTITILGIKALLINKCIGKDIDQKEIGWGKIPDNLDDILTSPDGEVVVLFQGELEPSKWLRAPIPLPVNGLEGTINITATFCYATKIDAQDPYNYTRSGLQVVFRPHSDKYKNDTQTHPDSRKFFSSSNYEVDLREDGHKWETTIHSSENLRASSLKDPSFDIHYHARTQGGKPINPDPIPYALVVSVKAPKVINIYDQVVNRYQTYLQPLVPIIDIPVRTII